MKSEKRRNVALTVLAALVAALLVCAAVLSVLGAWGGSRVANAEDEETNCETDGHVLVGTYTAGVEEEPATWSYTCSVCGETIALEEDTLVYSVTLKASDADTFTAGAAWNEIENIEPTIILQNDIEIHTATYFYRDATVDLNGKKLTGPNSTDNVYVFRTDVNAEYGDADPTLTIDDSVGTAEVDGYKLFYTMKDCTIVVNGGTYTISEGGKIANMKSGSLYINDGDFTCNGKTNGVELYNDLYANTEGAVGAYFEMNGGSITVTGAAAVVTSNNTQASGCKATINGGELISNIDTGIYWPIEGELTVNDGYIEGATGIDIKMGKLTVNGGKIVGTGEFNEDLNSNNSGSQNDGSAIRVDGQQYGSNSSYYIDSDELIVTINGGELVSQNGHAVAIYDNEVVGDNEEEVSVSITGGNFTSAENCDSLLFKSADDSEANDEDSEFNMSVSISGGTYDSPFHGSMLSDDIVSASYDGTVYVGSGEEVSEAITAAAIEAGDENVEITIIAGSGDLIFTDFEVTVTVSEDYGYEGGEISVNLTDIDEEFTSGGSIEAHEHSWDEGEVTTEPTCTEDGETTYTCESCNETYTVAIAALGHTYSEEPVYKDGSWYDVCEACKDESLISNGTGRTFKVQTLDELQSALDMDGAIVEMQNDIAGPVTVSVSVTLDLNGYTLSDAEIGTASADDATYTAAIAVLRGGDLTVMDSSIAKSGVVDGVTDGKGALVIEAGGSAVLNGGTFTRSRESSDNSWYTIANAGTLTINEGTTVKNNGTYYAAIVNGWTSEEVLPMAYYAGSNSATLDITGGTFSGGLYTVLNEDGETEISGGDFTNGYVATIANRSSLTISGGKFANEYDGSDFDSCLILNLEGNDGSDPVTVISGGELNGAIIIEAGTVTVGSKVYGEDGPETLEIETDEAGDQSIVGNEDEGDDDEGNEWAPSGEEKTYVKSLAWTVGLSAGVGIVIVLGLILTAVGCDTRKRK